MENTGLKICIETYGCQMNIADSEIVASILQSHNYVVTKQCGDADIVLINTCSVRAHAEQRVRGRLNVLRLMKKNKPEMIIGIIGCMAERLKEKLFTEEKVVDLVVGPDAYRNLPALIEEAINGHQAICIDLSEDETYQAVQPFRFMSKKVSAFVSIMRGCNNYCSYCIVPYTRGRERSRNVRDIIAEISRLIDQGYREVLLLGQNVNSYHWENEQAKENFFFADLLQKVAELDSSLRVRFTTSHPRDMSDETLHVIAAFKNIGKHIHLPVQSGSDRILKLMNRNYTREAYMNRISAIRSIIAGCSITTDILSGFCTETQEDHRQTLSLMKWAGFDYSYMFQYSVREGTQAAEKLKDDVSSGVKTERLNDIIALQKQLSLESNARDMHRVFDVLAEGVSKKSNEELSGRNSHNKTVVFPKMDYQPGQYVQVEIVRYTKAALIGKIV